MPFSPAREAMVPDATVSAHPAASVTIDPAPKTASTRAVLQFANGCSTAGCGVRRCGRPGWLSGMLTCHFGELRTRLSSSIPPNVSPSFQRSSRVSVARAR